MQGLLVSDCPVLCFPLGNFEADFTAFLRDFPGYDAAQIDALRKREFARLDQPGSTSTYLDYTGGSLYAESTQLKAYTDKLKGSILGNPHSINPTSMASDSLVEAARDAIAEYFHANGEYEVSCFRSNAHLASFMSDMSPSEEC